jgi:acyl-CoA thioester hydrolase
MTQKSDLLIPPHPHLVETSFHVRYAETDAMGIVHHANYIIWFEEGRSAFMRAHGTSYRVFETEGVQLAVSEVQARYLAPAVYDSLITVQCWLESLQSRKMRFGYQIVDRAQGQVLVTGYTVHICITAAGKVARIPAKWLTLFERVSEAKPKLP